MEQERVSDRASGSQPTPYLVFEELRSADMVTTAMWALFAAIGIVYLYQYYRRGSFGLDFATVWAAAHALLHHRTKWGQFVYLPGCLIFVIPLAVLPLRLARILLYAVLFMPVVLLTLGRRDRGIRLIQTGVALALFFPFLPDLTAGFPSIRSSDVIALIGLLLILWGTGRVATAGEDDAALTGARLAAVAADSASVVHQGTR